MTNVDLSPLIRCDAEYAYLLSAMTEKFNTAWDDAVHDSFTRFVQQMQENGRKLHEIRMSAELLKNAADACDAEALQAQAQALEKEADDV